MRWSAARPEVGAVLEERREKDEVRAGRQDETIKRLLDKRRIEDGTNGQKRGSGGCVYLFVSACVCECMSG